MTVRDNTRKLEAEVAAAATLTAPARVRARDIATVVARLATIEDWLASGMSPRQAVTRACKPEPDGFGITRSYANRFVGTALNRLQKDSALEPIESKRARMVAMLQSNIQRALSAKRAFSQNGEVIEYDAPDLKAANSAIALLAQIEGLAVDT